MKKITLFVGDCDESLAQTSKQFDCEAVLIDQHNCLDYINSTTGFTGYTSLADLPKDLFVFYNLLNIADSIIYCPPTKWSDNKSVNINNITSSVQGLTEFFLFSINKIKNNVHNLNLSNFDISKYVILADTRKTQNTQLWVAGCSTTFGMGVKETERYGYLLSKSIDTPVSFLASPGTSISWAADQILRSDIKENDIIVWGLTEENRLSFWNDTDDQLVNLTAQSTNFKVNLPTNSINKLLVNKINFVIAIQRILEVVNFCNKTKSKLLILNIHASNLLTISLHSIKEFFPYIQPIPTYIDIGNDNVHPGPKQHQAYADFCHSALKKLQYI